MKIGELQDQFKDLVAQQHETRSLMKEGQLGRNPIKDKLRELFSELNQYQDEKKVKLGEIEGVKR